MVYYKTTTSIFNKILDIEPRYGEFEVTCVVDYHIDPGQRGILFAAPEDCQPEYPPEVEIELVDAFIEYGSYKHTIGVDSIWWNMIEAQLLGNDSLQDEIFAHDYERQEDGAY